MRTIKTVASALVVALVVITSLDYAASAATGHAFVLGKINKSNKLSVLKRTTSGSTLQLSTTSSAAAPLVVNGHGKVVNLNADTVDGVDSSALKTKSYVYTIPVTAATEFAEIEIPVPVGRYVVSYSTYMFNLNSTEAVGCVIETDPAVGSSTFVGHSRFSAAGYSPGVTGSGFVEKVAGTSIRLLCDASAPFTTPATEPIQIVATRVDALGGGTLSLAP